MNKTQTYVKVHGGNLIACSNERDAVRMAERTQGRIVNLPPMSMRQIVRISGNVVTIPRFR